MRSMAVRRGEERSPSLFVLLTFLATIFVAVSAWDEKDLTELKQQAREAKRRALMYAVEESGHREYYASDAHCRVPLKGERLEMQRASNRDPGRGYRCIYRMLMQPQNEPSIAYVTWSRSPDVRRAIVLRSER